MAGAGAVTASTVVVVGDDSRHRILAAPLFHKMRRHIALFYVVFAVIIAGTCFRIHSATATVSSRQATRLEQAAEDMAALLDELEFADALLC